MINLAYEQKYLHLKSQVNDYHYFMAPEAQSITELSENEENYKGLQVYRGKA